jgi:O-antigen/teichoic acid export membrane protein
MKLDRKTLFNYTLPLIIGGLSDELLMLLDVYLISFKGDEYLAAIGLIDAFLLCILTFGDSLNDAYQNYYSRNIAKRHFNISLQKKSIWIFLKYGLLITLVFGATPYGINLFFKNEIFSLLLDTIPILIPLIVVDYVSMSLNAYLVGNDKLKEIGKLAVFELIFNSILGYILLYELDLNVSPLWILVGISLMSKIITAGWMFWYIKKITPPNFKTYPIKDTLFKTLRDATVYPALLDISYYIGTFILFIFCSIYFKHSEIALLTLFFSYIGILSVTSEAFSETSLNHFSSIYAKKNLAIFPKLSTEIIFISLLTTAIIFLGVIVVDLLLYGFVLEKLFLFLIIPALVLFDTYNEIYSIAIIVRLKNDLLASAHFIYGIVCTIAIVFLTFLWRFEAISILLAILIAQIATYIYLKRINGRVWKVLK